MTPRRFGLRARVITAFAIGALLLSMLLSAVTYSLTLANLVERRQDFSQKNALQNAQDLNGELAPRTDPARFGRLMSDYVTPEGTEQGMLHSGAWTWSNTFGALGFTDAQLPEALEDALAAGQASEMTFNVNESVYYTVAYPLPNLAPAPVSIETDQLDLVTGEDDDPAGTEEPVVSFYLQATPLDDVEDTVNGLLATLLGASAITTVLGAGFGVYVATRVFNPLSEVSAAAAQIAEGDLATRLDEVQDPDLGRLVGSFNEMTSALEERILRDSRFASDVSHELRSPLMTLTGSVAVIEKRRDDMPERAQVALDLLSADIRRFKILVEDLLEISRFDVGAVELETEEVLLTEFVRHALYAASGGQRNPPVIHGDDAEDLIVEIDKRRIAQVIRNLSENADKYADGVTQARIERDGDDVRIELEDEGPGVPVDERELIFDRFARGSEGGRRGSGTGVGLGLSLVVEHLRLHGGTVHVDDRVDGLLGARFVISLPNVVADE